MRPFNSIHVPHFQHFSARGALVTVRDQLSGQNIELTMTLAILFGLLMALTFWVAVAR